MLEERAGVKQSFNVEAKVAHLLARYGVCESVSTALGLLFTAVVCVQIVV